MKIFVRKRKTCWYFPFFNDNLFRTMLRGNMPCLKDPVYSI